MANRLLKWIAAAIVLVGGLTVAQAQTAAPVRPAVVPADFTITPFGYFHPSCIQHLAEGDEVRRDEALIRHTNGTATNIQACAYPHYKADGVKVVGDDPPVEQPNISHSWIVSESVTDTTSYGFLTAEWTVPPAPASNDGQTIFYFPGLEQSSKVVTILQPVLGWNNDFRPSAVWSIASWNCCVTGTVQEATPQHANPGDTILGYMYATCSTLVVKCATWNIITQDLQSGNFSQLTNTSNFNQAFNWAFGGVLEVYGVKQCSDYPHSLNGWSAAQESPHLILTR